MVMVRLLVVLRGDLGEALIVHAVLRRRHLRAPGSVRVTLRWLMWPTGAVGVAVMGRRRRRRWLLASIDGDGIVAVAAPTEAGSATTAAAVGRFQPAPAAGWWRYGVVLFHHGAFVLLTLTAAVEAGLLGQGDFAAARSGGRTGAPGHREFITIHLSNTGVGEGAFTVGGAIGNVCCLCRVRVRLRFSRRLKRCKKMDLERAINQSINHLYDQSTNKTVNQSINASLTA